MIALEVNGTEYTDFTSVTASVSVDSISGSFNFTSASDTITRFPIKLGDECRVLVDGISVIKGFVEIIETEYDTGSHTVNISGRDNTADIIDSTLAESVELKGITTLIGLAEKILSTAGIVISVSTEETIDEFKETEIESGAIGQGVFDLIEKYARKRQVLVTSDGYGNIEFVRAGTIDYGVKLQNTIDGGDENNIKSARVFRNEAERFGKYVVKSQDNISSLPFLGAIDAKDVIDKKNDAVIDSDIRQSRTLCILAESSSDADQCKKRSEWERGVRLSRYLGYTAVVQGHSTEKGIWRKNSLVDVEDDFADINDKLLIESINFRYSISEGSTTELSMVPKTAYTLFEPVAVTQSFNLPF